MNTPSPASPRIVVIGGGISGLAAAHRLATTGAEVTLLEGSGRIGGKLLTGEIAGTAVDLGAEALFALRPEAVDLARATGLGDRLQPAATTSASLWTRGVLRALPKGQIMGVPGDLDALAAAGVLTEAELARVARDRALPRTEVDGDASVGGYVAARMGRAVVDRLVEPLLGGVYAGRADGLSLRATIPQLFPAVNEHDSLLDAVAALRQRADVQPRPQGPLFQGVVGGVGALPEAVADVIRARGGVIRCSTPALEITRSVDGWSVRTHDRLLAADGIVLAVPAWHAAALLAPHSPAAAHELDTVEYASSALVTLAFRRRDHARWPSGSGFLVPPVDGHTVKACTLLSNKWRWVTDAAPDLFVLRASVGRHGEEDALFMDDPDLVASVWRELAEAVGIAARPIASEVTRWIGALPQYAVGHAGRVARIRDAAGKLPGLALCGAAYDGVGIPACIAGGRQAAEELTASLAVAD